MKQKPLIETNPYLCDPEKLRKALITSVASSTAIETGASVESIARMLEEPRNPASLKSVGFRSHELTKVRAMVSDNRRLFLEK